MGSVVATPTAIDTILRLRARHGTIALHQSGGCCAGSSPMCLTEAELPSGPNDIQLGEIGGIPFLIDRDLYDAWGKPDFVVDVAAGADDSFSLETPDGIRFTSRAPKTANEENPQMKAAVVHDFAKPLTIENVPIPEPGAEQVLVRIEACGLCHTDIHAARGEWPVKPSPPFIPGHEGVGIVERLGSGNSHGLEVGMRVALPWLGYACGDCRYCNSGRETLCLKQLNTGYGIDGGFAEFAVGYARHLVRVPDELDPLDAAPLSCAGVTTYKAVKESGARSSDLVAVFGVGGLGHLAVQYARVTGASVIAVDINEERLRSATELGAEHVINAAQEDPAEAIQKLGGVDVAIATAVSPIAFEQAMGSLARGGRLVCVGLPAENELRVPIFQTVLGGLSLKGSIVGTHHDLEEVFELHRRGETRVLRAERRLEDVNEAIAQVLGGSAPEPRLVFQMQPVAADPKLAADVAQPAGV